MPWVPEDAPKHTKKATTPGQKNLWAKVANRELAESGDEGKAIRFANLAVENRAHVRRIKWS